MNRAIPQTQPGLTLRARRQPARLPEPQGGGNRHHVLLASLVLTVGAIWIAVPLVALVAGARSPLPDLGTAGIGVLLTVGIGQVLWGLDLLLRRHTLTIDGGLLHVAVRGLTGERRWSEPLANYRGLRHRRQRVRHRYGWRVTHRLQLAHPDPAKEIDLLTARGDRQIEAARRQWAEMLNLPLWSATDAGAALRSTDTRLRERPEVDAKVPGF